ncbi:MAG: outer membrane beta-barrel family protein [Taibaiella sp.]|nr:outer membrane beta-barrel family protein [Taibaiella sp.]
MLTGRYQDAVIFPTTRHPPYTLRVSEKGIFFADLGMSKDLWNSNATIGLNIRDVFNSRRWRNETATETLYSLTDFQWRPRSIRLVFTYRFNQTFREVEKKYADDGPEWNGRRRLI